MIKISAITNNKGVVIERFHMTSWRPCWCTLKRILVFSFAWDTNMAATLIVFCVSWEYVKMLYSDRSWFLVRWMFFFVRVGNDICFRATVEVLICELDLVQCLRKA